MILAMSLFSCNSFCRVQLQNSGYETFKNVLKSNQGEQSTSGTVNGSVEFIDNNKTIAKVSGEITGDEKAKAFSGDLKIEVDGLEKDVALFGSNDKMYIHDLASDDVYTTELDDDTHDF